MNELIDGKVGRELERLGITYKAVGCIDEHADTSVFCQLYGYNIEQSANALLVCSTKGETVFAMCVILAHTRLDTNKTARKKLGVRRISFARAEQTVEVTGMQLGGVTPIGMPDNVPVWIDSRVLACEQIILGGGNRTSKIIMPPDQLLKIPRSEVVNDLATYRPVAIDDDLRR